MTRTATATPALATIFKLQPNLLDTEQAAAHIGVTRRTMARPRTLSAYARMANVPST